MPPVARVCPGWIATKPDPQCTTSGDERYAGPASRVTINRPQLHAIRLCREIRVKKPDYCEDGNHPAFAASFAHAGAKISAGEKRYD